MRHYKESVVFGTAIFSIKKLVASDGRCPFDEWFEALTSEDKYMVENRLLRIRLGVFGEINNVGDGIWELKFRKGRAIRIYYKIIKNNLVLLILGGDKRTQPKDITKAKRLIRDL